LELRILRIKLGHEPRGGSEERGKRERGAGINVRNSKMEEFLVFLNSIFSNFFDLLLWI
jgi:hypothetical protein